MNELPLIERRRRVGVDSAAIFLLPGRLVKLFAPGYSSLNEPVAGMFLPAAGEPPSSGSQSRCSLLRAEGTVTVRVRRNLDGEFEAALSQTMAYLFLADLVLVVHLTFILFAVAGGLLILRSRKWVWFHLPAVFWAALIEFEGWICPLTPLENRLRGRAGEGGYENGFIERYLLAAIYPGGLTRELQILLGLFVLTVNLLIYSWAVIHAARSRR